jgi:hypothetical protein
VPGSWVIPLGLGKEQSEFIDVIGADQLALGEVIARRHRPVAAGCAAAPDPPPRVLAPEPLKFAVLVVPVPARGHARRPLIAGAASPAAWRQLVMASYDGAASAPPG